MKTEGLTAGEGLDALKEEHSIISESSSYFLSPKSLTNGTIYIKDLIYYAPYSIALPEKSESEKAWDEFCLVDVAAREKPQGLSKYFMAFRNWIIAYVKEQGEKK